MISITPNLRNVKPASKYMEKRVRMLGRGRMANEFNRTGSNVRSLALSWVPASKDLLEVYHDGIRMLDGWTLSGSTVNFTRALNGTFKVIDDTLLIDPGEKWLKIDVKNLLHFDDLDFTSYGTDRRAGQNVAVHCRPVAITQGGIGYVRPSPDNQELWYSSYYGLFGRDSITYAILADNGQLSDYRCIDIRVRDPNYIPTIRMCAVSALSAPVKVNDEVVDIEEANGTYQVYGETLKDGIMQLPNKNSLDEIREFHFIIQGKDENGDWFELEEYFEPDEYVLAYPTEHDDFIVTSFGDASGFGFTNAYRLSVTCLRNTSVPFTVTLTANNQQLFFAQIVSSGITEQQPYILRETDRAVTFDQNVDGVDPDNVSAKYTFNSWVDRMRMSVEWTNETAELRNVKASYTAQLDLVKPYYDPALKLPVPATTPINHEWTGTFDTREPNAVTVEYQSVDILPEKLFVWESNDQFSPMALIGPHTYTIENDWVIVPPEPEPEPPVDPQE